MSGAPLSDALRISATILREQDHKHEHLTALTAIWGQLVSHDIAYTLPISGYSECCANMMENTGGNAECLPIMMENYTCQEYVRSAIGLKPGCLLGPRLVRVSLKYQRAENTLQMVNLVALKLEFKITLFFTHEMADH